LKSLNNLDPIFHYAEIIICNNLIKKRGDFKTGFHEMFASKVLHINADEEIVNVDGEVDYARIDFL
jgi:hypothetical protein